MTVIESEVEALISGLINILPFVTDDALFDFQNIIEDELRAREQDYELELFGMDG